jgi:hypothetical protein
MGEFSLYMEVDATHQQEIFCSICDKRVTPREDTRTRFVIRAMTRPSFQLQVP